MSWSVAASVWFFDDVYFFFSWSRELRTIKSSTLVIWHIVTAPLGIFQQATRLWKGDTRELKWRRTTSRSREIPTATKTKVKLTRTLAFWKIDSDLSCIRAEEIVFYNKLKLFVSIDSLQCDLCRLTLFCLIFHITPRSMSLMVTRPKFRFNLPSFFSLYSHVALYKLLSLVDN